MIQQVKVITAGLSTQIQIPGKSHKKSHVAWHIHNPNTLQWVDRQRQENHLEVWRPTSLTYASHWEKKTDSAQQSDRQELSLKGCPLSL